MKLVLKHLSSENAVDEVTSLLKLCEGKRSAEETRTSSLIYIGLLRDMEAYVTQFEQWTPLKLEIQAAV
jgi:hypothetical protein